MFLDLEGNILPLGQTKRELVWNTLTDIPNDWLEIEDSSQANPTTFQDTSSGGGYYQLTTGTENDSISKVKYKYDIDLTDDNIRAVVWTVENFRQQSSAADKHSIGIGVAGTDVGFSIFQESTKDKPVLRMRRSGGSTDYELNIQITDNDGVRVAKHLSLVIMPKIRHAYVLWGDQVLFANLDYGGIMDVGSVNPYFSIKNKVNDGNTRYVRFNQIKLQVWTV
jgi:hypothetical protein